MESTVTVASEQSFVAKWGSLVILSLALAIIIIDTTLLNVSLGVIIRDLKTDIESLQWVITAYALMLAAFTVTGGRLGDLFGRKRMFVLGAIIFAVGSFLASESHSVGTLVWGEAIIEGIGAALMMPATSSLLVSNFHGRDRAIAFGVWGGIAAASSAIGPLLGGYLTSHYSWRWGFRINVFVAAMLVIGSLIVHESRDTRRRPTFDFVGVVLSATGLLAIVFGVIKASTYGWFFEKIPAVLFGHTIDLNGISFVPYSIAVGFLILIVFGLWEIWIERRGRMPLVSLRLFRNQQFISGAMTMGIVALGQAGMFFSLPIFLQSVMHLDAFHTGLVLLPMSLSLLVGAPFSAYISKFFSPKRLIQVGLCFSVIGFFVLRRSVSVDMTDWALAPGLTLYGFGMGFVMAQINNLTLSAVKPQEAGEASGVNNTMRQVGSTLGSAIIGSVLLSAIVANLTSGIALSSVIPVGLKTQLVDAVSTQMTNVEFGDGVQIHGNISPVVQKEIANISAQATVDANKLALVYGAIFVFLGLLASTRLPNLKPSGRASTANDEEEGA